MSSSKNVNEQIAGLNAIIRLCQSQIEFKKTLLKEEILTYIINVLDNFPHMPKALEQAIILLATLASDLEVVRQQCIVEEIPLILLGILKLSSHEESLVEVTFETLGKEMAKEIYCLVASLFKILFICLVSAIHREKKAP